MRWAFAFAGIAALVAQAHDAGACGAAYPGGPMVCTMADAPSAQKAHAPSLPRARVFASYAYTSTTILFTGDRRADIGAPAAQPGIAIRRQVGDGIGKGAQQAGIYSSCDIGLSRTGRSRRLAEASARAGRVM